jgi:hypothetical protein
MGDMRNAYTVLVREPQVKYPLGRFRHSFEDNTKMNFRGYEVVYWIGLAQGRERFRVHGNDEFHNKNGSFVDRLPGYQLFKKDPARWG